MSESKSTDDPLEAPLRLADLDSSGLLEAATIEALDSLALAAHNVFGRSSTGAIKAVAADQAVIVSISSEGGMPRSSFVPLSHSMCKHVVISGAPYIVDDATVDPVHAPAVRDYAVGAYIGFPLHGTQGTVLGAVCAVMPDPHHWTPQEFSIMGSIAMAAEAVVAMHTAARAERMARISGAADAGVFDKNQVFALKRSHANAKRLRDTLEYLEHPTTKAAALPRVSIASSPADG